MPQPVAKRPEQEREAQDSTPVPFRFTDWAAI